MKTFSYQSWRNFFFITTLMTLFIAVSTSAAIWQNYRYHYKKMILLKREQQNKSPVTKVPAFNYLPIGEREFSLVSANGSYLENNWFFWDSYAQMGKRAYMLMVPFVIDDTGKIVLVSLGWLPMDDAFSPKSQQCITNIMNNLKKINRIYGVVRRFPPKRWFFRTVSFQDNKVLSNLDASFLSKYLDKNVDPWQIVLRSESHSCLNSSYQDKPQVYPDRHLGYVYQWLTFLIFSLVFYVRYAYKFFRSINSNLS